MSSTSHVRLIEAGPASPVTLVVMSDPAHGIEATVAPAGGGEISSLKWQGQELLYRANLFEDPGAGGWRGRAPLLWPAVGRGYGPNRRHQVLVGGADPNQGSFWYKGVEWPMPIHGFAFRRSWAVIELGGEPRPWVLLRLRSDEETRRYYPFDFVLEVVHELRPGALRSTYRVQARSDGLICSFGNHLTLALPGDENAFDQTTVKVSSPAAHLLQLQPPGLVTGVSRSVPDLSQGGVRLADPAYLDAVVGGFTSAPACLEVRHPELPPIVVSHWGRRLAEPAPRPPAYESGPVEDDPFGLSPGHYHFVLWGSRTQRFFCPEPWYGLPDSLNRRDGIILLGAGESAEWVMEVRVGGEMELPS